MGGISLCNLHCLTTAPHCSRCPSAQQKPRKLATGNFSFRFLPSQGSLRQTICKADCSVVSRMSNFSANTKGDPKNAKCRVSLINKFYKSYLSLKNKTKKASFWMPFVLVQVVGGLLLRNPHRLTTAPHCSRYPSSQQKPRKLATGNFSFRFLPSQGSTPTDYIKIKKTPFGVFFYFGAGGGSRTHTVSLPQDFESSASASSTTPAFRTRYILPLFL